MKTAFIGYYQPTEQEFADLWLKCFFTFDANTLLNLYRYSPETSQELLRILSHAKIKDRIWIPHQVGYEFFQNRLTVIAEQRKAYEDVKKELNKPLASFQSRHRHPFVDDTRLQNLSTLISDLVTELDRRRKLLELQQNDPIVHRLFEMFEKKVGPA
jgi:PIN like domain